MTYKPTKQKQHSLFHNDLFSALVLLLSTFIALVWTNSFIGHFYFEFWSTKLNFVSHLFSINFDYKDVINMGFMSFFFFLIGLEIKKEIIVGELRHFRRSLLPVVAAIGGMVVPSLFYLGITYSHRASQGWAIPMATDVAFAVAILSLVGKKVPSYLRSFLLTLAIVDDIGSTAVIAIAYPKSVHIEYLGFSFLLILVIILSKKITTRNYLYILLAPLLWILFLLSGIQAALCGFVIGILIPIGLEKPNVGSPGRFQTYLKLIKANKKAEDLIRPYVNFLVMPMFAFANTGIVFTTRFFKDPSMEIILGIVGGLVIGKTLGVVGSTWLVVKLGRVKLPKAISWSHLLGLGFLSGIGFTVSLLMADLALSIPLERQAAKSAVLVGSAIAAVIGVAILSKPERLKK